MTKFRHWVIWALIGHWDFVICHFPANNYGQQGRSGTIIAPYEI
jgi:hypothetical protein